MDVGPLRHLRHAELHQHQGAGELPRGASASPIPTRNAGGATVPPHAGLRPPEGGRARSSARISAWSPRSGSPRPASSRSRIADLSPLQRFCPCPRRMPCGALGRRHLRNLELRQSTRSRARARGPGSTACFACRMPRPGRMAIAPMLNAARPGDGRPLRRLYRAGPLSPRRIRLCGGVPHALVLAGRIRLMTCSCAAPCSHAHGLRAVRPEGAHLAGTAGGFRRIERGVQVLRGAARRAVGLSPAIVQRCGFTGELGYELWVTPDFQATLYDEILEAGERSRPRRISAAGRSPRSGWRRTMAPSTRISGPITRPPKPGSTPSSTSPRRDFIGRDAVLAEKAARARKALRRAGGRYATPTSSATSRS